jgi:hypothetical protein
MGNFSNCGCGVCEIEKGIVAELGFDESRKRYGQLVAGRLLLLTYPTPAELVAQLHACRNGRDPDHISDRIFIELLNDQIFASHWELLERLLLLIFIPAVHATVRQVSNRYPFLPREDIAQHALTTLLQSLRSEDWRTRRSHFAFSMARKLRRSTFEWAIREFRQTSQFAAQEIGDAFPSAQTAEQAFERNAVLRNFLSLCQARAYLTPEELNLLVEFKLEATSRNGVTYPSDHGSNIFRQRLKRLMNKLRRLARTTKEHKTVRSDHSEN